MEIGQYNAGEYTQGFIDGLMALAKAAKLDFCQSGNAVTVERKGTVVLKLIVQEPA